MGQEQRPWISNDKELRNKECKTMTKAVKGSSLLTEGFDWDTNAFQTLQELQSCLETRNRLSLWVFGFVHELFETLSFPHRRLMPLNHGSRKLWTENEVESTTYNLEWGKPWATS